MRVSLSPQFKARFASLQARGYFDLTQPVIIASKIHSLAFVPQTVPLGSDINKAEIDFNTHVPVFETIETLAAHVEKQEIAHANIMARQIRGGLMPLH